MIKKMPSWLLIFYIWTADKMYGTKFTLAIEACRELQKRIKQKR